MKILYFHQYFSTPKGSTGVRSYQISRKLAEKGHKVLMVCGSHTDGDTGLKQKPFLKGVRRGFVDGFEVLEFDLPYSNHLIFSERIKIFLKFVWKGMKLVVTEKYDLVFVSSPPLTVTVLGIFARLFRQKPFVFEVRDLWPKFAESMKVTKNQALLKAAYLLEKISYRSASACIALAPGIKDEIKRKGVPDDKIFIIPNGSDLNIFSPTQKKNDTYIQDLGFTKDDFIAVFAGAHGRANGLDEALKAARLLTNTNIKFLFIGDGALKADLIQTALEEKLNNCHFMDPIPKHQLSAILSNCHVGLMILANYPDFYQSTSPNKFFDYIAAGLPVLTNYPGWIATLIRDAKCGATVPPEDPKAFSDALLKMSKEKEPLLVMSANARRLAEERFDWNKLSQKWIEVLETAATHNKK